MTKSELTEIISSEISTDEQKEQAQALLANLTESSATDDLLGRLHAEHRGYLLRVISGELEGDKAKAQGLLTYLDSIGLWQKYEAKQKQRRRG